MHENKASSTRKQKLDHLSFPPCKVIGTLKSKSFWNSWSLMHSRRLAQQCYLELHRRFWGFLGNLHVLHTCGKCIKCSPVARICGPETKQIQTTRNPKKEAEEMEEYKTKIFKPVLPGVHEMYLETLEK